MRRAASSPRPSAATPTPWCSSTRWRRPTPTCSTYYSRCWTTAGLPTAKAEPWTSRTPSSSSPPTWAPSTCWTASTRTGDITDEAKDAGATICCNHSFRPEFLNRLDEIVFYKPLTKDEHHPHHRPAGGRAQPPPGGQAAQGGPHPGGQAATSSTAPTTRPIGARPLRRFVQHSVETLISRKIIADEVQGGDTLTVDCRDGELTVESKSVLTGEVVNP